MARVTLNGASREDSKYLDVDWRSAPMKISNTDVYAYHLEWSGVVGVGKVEVEVGIRSSLDNQGVVRWALLDMDVIPVEESEGVSIISVKETGAEYIRLRYTAITSTAGTLKITSSANTVGY